MDHNQRFIPPASVMKDVVAMRYPRNVQGVFKPTRLAVAIAQAHRIAPPPALVVQFDKHRNIRTFEAPL